MTIRSKSSHMVIPVGALVKETLGLALLFSGFYGVLLVGWAAGF